ncbi:hypothetical protein PR048_023755 [Dryococelus australis]|uniref:Uncharacterized protein n=1 Tax=Dryococelus australis TaxID=614101 RepID=A0ABQ9GUZ8_9NEOP|nr:hypothetical protein PR048_023755 [Dryococelus australis]
MLRAKVTSSYVKPIRAQRDPRDQVGVCRDDVTGMTGGLGRLTETKGESPYCEPSFFLRPRDIGACHLDTVTVHTSRLCVIVQQVYATGMSQRRRRERTYPANVLERDSTITPGIMYGHDFRSGTIRTKRHVIDNLRPYMLPLFRQHPGTQSSNITNASVAQLASEEDTIVVGLVFRTESAHVFRPDRVVTSNRDRIQAETSNCETGNSLPPVLELEEENYVYIAWLVVMISLLLTQNLKTTEAFTSATMSTVVEGLGEEQGLFRVAGFKLQYTCKRNCEVSLVTLAPASFLSWTPVSHHKKLDGSYILFPLSKHVNTGDSNARDQRTIARKRKALNRRVVLPSSHFPLQSRFVSAPPTPTKATPGSIPGRVTPDFRVWESCRTMPSVRRAFSGISRFPRPFIPALLHSHLNRPHLHQSLRSAFHSRATHTTLLRRNLTGESSRQHPGKRRCSPFLPPERTCRLVQDVRTYSYSYYRLLTNPNSREQPPIPRTRAAHVPAKWRRRPAKCPGRRSRINALVTYSPYGSPANQESPAACSSESDKMPVLRPSRTQPTREWAHLPRKEPPEGFFYEELQVDVTHAGCVCASLDVELYRVQRRREGRTSRRKSSLSGPGAVAHPIHSQVAWHVTRPACVAAASGTHSCIQLRASCVSPGTRPREVAGCAGTTVAKPRARHLNIYKPFTAVESIKSPKDNANIARVYILYLAIYLASNSTVFRCDLSHCLHPTSSQLYLFMLSFLPIAEVYWPPAKTDQDFCNVGIVPDDSADPRVLSWIFRFRRPCIPALLHIHLASPSSALEILRAGQTSQENSFSYSCQCLRFEYGWFERSLKNAMRTQKFKMLYVLLTFAIGRQFVWLAPRALVANIEGSKVEQPISSKAATQVNDALQSPVTYDITTCAQRAGRRTQKCERAGRTVTQANACGPAANTVARSATHNVRALGCGWHPAVLITLLAMLQYYKQQTAICLSPLVAVCLRRLLHILPDQSEFGNIGTTHVIRVQTVTTPRRAARSESCQRLNSQSRLMGILLARSSAYWSISCVFTGCCPTPGSYGIRKAFPCKSAIDSEACRTGLINCDPLVKDGNFAACTATNSSAYDTRGRKRLSFAGGENKLLCRLLPLSSRDRNHQGGVPKRYSAKFPGVKNPGPPILWGGGGALAERLHCSPPTKANRARSPAESLPDFCMWNRAGRCRWWANFLGGHPFPPPFISALLHTSVTRIDSQDLAVDFNSADFTVNSVYAAVLWRGGGGGGRGCEAAVDDAKAPKSTRPPGRGALDPARSWPAARPRSATFLRRHSVSPSLCRTSRENLARSLTCRPDSTVLCILEPQLCVHWLLPQRVASVTPHLAVWDSLLVSLQVCYWLRGIQGVSNKLVVSLAHGCPLHKKTARIQCLVPRDDTALDARASDALIAPSISCPPHRGP